MKQKSMETAAFSLIELLAVCAIFAILAVLTVPALSSLNENYKLVRQGQQLVDQLALARQLAMVRNREMELRFRQKVADGQTNWGMQLWILNPAEGTSTPYGKLIKFEEGLIFQPDLSPLLPLLPTATNASGETWQALRFHANGKLAASMTITNNYLTVQTRQASVPPSGNFFTVQINPVTGSVTTYRP